MDLVFLGEIILDNKAYNVYLRNSKRRVKRLSFSYKDNTFYVSSPKRLLINKKEILNQVKLWGEKLNKNQRLNNVNAIEKDDNGRYIYLFGEKYYLNQNDEISFNNSLVKVDELFYKRIKNLVYPYLLERFLDYKTKMNIKENYSFKLKTMKTRLGSNSKKTKTIYLSLKMIHYSFEIIDSVIIHELAHCYFFDHSKNFYNIVYTYSPNYNILRKKILRGIVK